jgi:hypothetical protein
MHIDEVADKIFTAATSETPAGFHTMVIVFDDEGAWRTKFPPTNINTVVGILTRVAIQTANLKGVP